MNRLKERREYLKLTQRDVAEKVGIAEQAYQRYEYGKSIPNVLIAIKIANALNATVNALWVT